jgi:hypothetical protein
MPNLEVIAYLLILITCALALLAVTRSYAITKKRLPFIQIVDLARAFFITLSFIILKLSMDQVYFLGDIIPEKVFKILSMVLNMLILLLVFY